MRKLWYPVGVLLLATDLSVVGTGCGDMPPPEPGPYPPDVTVPCTGEGGHCDTSADCCGTLTCDGDNAVCSDGGCFAKGVHCTRSSDCCGALTCEDGICGDGSCHGLWVHCDFDYDCCGSLTCDSGSFICTDGSCRPEGVHCSHSGQCCGSLVCGSLGVCE